MKDIRVLKFNAQKLGAVEKLEELGAEILDDFKPASHSLYLLEKPKFTCNLGKGDWVAILGTGHYPFHPEAPMAVVAATLDEDNPEKAEVIYMIVPERLLSKIRPEEASAAAGRFQTGFAAT